MNNITVILNGYKRKENLEIQKESLLNQSLLPGDILLWYNYPGSNDLINENICGELTTSLNNFNWGVWARFAFALNCNTEYICIFDDDTIPGKKWLENCYNSIQVCNGLLGTIGLTWKGNAQSYYDGYMRCGWNDNHNHTIVPVDIVGHSWFFKREWLSYFWRELPDFNKYRFCGEDMHFSYMLQKYGNIGTFVPPHPINDKEMWGSINGGVLGGDEHSLWETNVGNFKYWMNEYFKEQRQNGWKLLNDK